jgi:hypothetical protein
MDEKEKNEQLAKISYQLLQINENLERILNAQFGIDDPEWINAINKLEEGFGLAFSWVVKTKEVHVPKVYDNEDVKRVLCEIDPEIIVLKIIENMHRVILDDKDRNSQLYNIWRLGKESGKFKTIEDLAEKISMSEQKLREIISSEEVKRSVVKSSEIKSTVNLSDIKPLVKLSDKEEKEKITANTKERYERILTSKDEYEKMLADKREKEELYWSKYVPVVRPYIYWLKDLITSSKNGIVSMKLSYFAKECGFKMKDLFNNDDDDNNDNPSENLEEINPHELYNGFKFALNREDIFVDIGTSKIGGQLYLVFENEEDHFSNKYDDEYVIINLKVPRAFEGQEHFSKDCCIYDYVRHWLREGYFIGNEEGESLPDGIIDNGFDIAPSKKEIQEIVEQFENDKSWIKNLRENGDNEDDEGDLDFIDLFNIVENNIEDKEI